MRLLKLSAALWCLACIGTLSVSAQSPQLAQHTQPAAQTQTQAARETAPQPDSRQDRPFRKIIIKTIIVPQKPQQAPQSPDDRLQIRDAFKVSAESLQRALQEARAREQLQPYRLLAGNEPQRNDQPGGLDRGIYLSQIDGANFCGTIVSYHFSPGELPKPVGVTTCTPWNAVVSKRTNGPNRTPQRPQLIRTVYQEQGKK